MTVAEKVGIAVWGRSVADPQRSRRYRRPGAVAAPLPMLRGCAPESIVRTSMGGECRSARGAGNDLPVSAAAREFHCDFIDFGHQRRAIRGAARRPPDNTGLRPRLGRGSSVAGASKRLTGAARVPHRRPGGRLAGIWRRARLGTLGSGGRRRWPCGARRRHGPRTAWPDRRARLRGRSNRDRCAAELAAQLAV